MKRFVARNEDLSSASRKKEDLSSASRENERDL